MNLRIVYALILRYLFLYTRNWIRVSEVVFWPTMELLTWGFLTKYLKDQNVHQESGPIHWLLGGVIFWDVMFRSQQGVAVSFLEDVWSRNLLNVFVAPVRAIEYVVATFGVGLIRILVTVALLTALAFGWYEFNLFSTFGVALIPFFAMLLFFGWSMGVFSTGIVMRFGQAAENLVWAIPFMIQPLTCVYYPVSVLPGWMQKVALALPSTHVFEGMRAVSDMKGHAGPFPWASLRDGLLLNVVWMLIAAWFYHRTLLVCREKGLLTKVATH